MDYDQILAKLEELARPSAVENAALLGIKPKTRYYGVEIRLLRRMAGEIGQNHLMAEALWVSNIHDARILATMIAAPGLMTAKQIDLWAAGFDSWDICDQCCANLFSKTNYAYPKAIAWSRQDDQYVKRAAFALMAILAANDKAETDDTFMKFLSVIKREATDRRHVVRNAIAWALRQIGQRSYALNQRSLEVAEFLQQAKAKTPRWIARDALREINSKAVQQRFSRHA
jgi:3-methyladenine DNA glycosylase AlkD